MAEMYEYTGYLVLKKGLRYWTELQGRLVANRPTKLYKGEVPVRVVVQVPKALFGEPPILEVRGEASLGRSDVEATLRAAGLDVVVVREEPSDV